MRHIHIPCFIFFNFCIRSPYFCNDDIKSVGCTFFLFSVFWGLKPEHFYLNSIYNIKIFTRSQKYKCHNNNNKITKLNRSAMCYTSVVLRMPTPYDNKHKLYYLFFSRKKEGRLLWLSHMLFYYLSIFHKVLYTVRLQTRRAAIQRIKRDLWYGKDDAVLMGTNWCFQAPTLNSQFE